MISPIVSSIREHPKQLAFCDGVENLTYADLASAISRSDVMKLEVKPGSHIAWSPKNDLDSFLTFWAIQSAGWTACPISHRFPEPKREQILRRISAAWLPKLVEERESGVLSISVDPESELSHAATIVLSSGSTGQPKAVVHRMKAHIANAVGAMSNLPLRPGDRWLWSLPLFHISGVAILVRCAISGATVVGTRNDNKLSAKLLDELRITHLSVVNAQLQRLLRDEQFPPSHLKYVLLGGSYVDPQLVKFARRRGVNVLTTYGLTETASQMTTSTSDGKPAACGCLLPGRELKISASGEILVRGEVLCLGYFIEGRVQPVVDNEGWFHTKDLGALDEDGELVVLGRMDNMFISGGENIHPENIERAMMSVFDIRQVIVVPQADAEFGARPVAFVSGDLPINWIEILRAELKGYEIPVKILSWPQGVEDGVKVQRSKLQALVENEN